MFPIDDETLHYLRFTGRPEEQVALVEAYAREQGMFHEPELGARRSTPTRSSSTSATSSRASPGPRRPQDRVPLHGAKESFRARAEAPRSRPAPRPPSQRRRRCALRRRGRSHGGRRRGAVADRGRGRRPRGERCLLDHGSVVIAAITSCTNTSNPAVMVGAGLLASNAVASAGCARSPWVKTSLAPGSKVVTDYLERSGLTAPLEQLGFNLVGYGCTTCIGNSGPLPEEISAAIEQGDLAVASVLSGNRNFEGRIHSEVKMNYLASPPLVVAYALAGRMDVDLVNEPLGEGSDGEPVYLRDIWPTQREIHDTIEDAVQSEMFRRSYADVYAGDERWNALEVPDGRHLRRGAESTYVKRPPYFDGHGRRAARRSSRSRARACWRCSATASRPTTSRPPARSARTAPPGAT